MENILKPEDYTDKRIFSLEQEKIFSSSWHFCGLVEDLKDNNQYSTVQAGNNNIVVFRNENGELQAFHNICRHRGMQLLEGKGKLQKQITCPYHDWTYNKEGQLKSLPKQKSEFPNIDKECLSLRAASVGVWRGMIWVHPEHDAEPVHQYFAAMENHIAPYQVEALIESEEYVVQEVIRANWKLVVENYIDHYHLAQLHAGTLNMYDHQRAEFGFADEHFYFWEPLTNDYFSDIESNAPYPLLIAADNPKIGAWVPMLFPCIGLAETESSWSVFQIVPLAVDKTKVIIRSKLKNCSSMTFYKQSFKSYNYWANKIKGKSKQHDQQHALGSADFMQEDIYVCEQLQKSLSSKYFVFGPSAVHGESPIRGFQRIVKQKLAAG